MQDKLLQEFVSAIASAEFHLHWSTYVVALLVSLLGAYLGSFLAGFAKRRGENYATKADFNELLDQLKRTTAVAEEVRTRVAHADWVSREQKTIRRGKLEQLIDLMHDTVKWQDSYRSAHIFQDGQDPGPSPINRFETIAFLYFPELSEATHGFGMKHKMISSEMLGCRSRLIDARDDHQQGMIARSEFGEEFKRLNMEQFLIMANVAESARVVMKDLVFGSPTEK